MAEEAARWLDREALAAYISVRVDEVRKLLRAGRLPTPSHHLGPKSPRWDRAAVDACFEGRATPPTESAEEAVQVLVEKLRRGDTLKGETGLRRHRR